MASRLGTMVAVVATALSCATFIGCDEPLFVAPACTEDEPEAFGAFVEDEVIEVVITTPFDPNGTRGSFSILEADTVTGGTLLTQSSKRDFILTIRPEPGASLVSFRTTALCSPSGADPSDGSAYPKYQVVIVVPATHVDGDPVRVTLTRENQV